MPDIETLRSLLERVESAESADRELDADIVSALGYAVEWKQANYTMDLYPVVHWDSTREPCPHFSASIDASVALIERLLPGWGWAIEMSGKSFAGSVWDEDDLHGLSLVSAPLALLAALLRALIAREEGRAV